MTPEQLAALAAEREAHDAFDRAMIARDAIERCCSDEWRAAHVEATRLARAWKRAREATFACGAASKPYWW